MNGVVSTDALDLDALAEPPLPPYDEGALTLADGRQLTYSQFGAPDGETVVLWFHGTPGARRQIPPHAPAHALEAGIRIVSPDRPGVGGSDPHHARTLLSWAGDVEQLTDHLGIDRFGVAGLSGGGPHVLSVAHELPDRVASGALLGGLVPMVGPDAPPSTPDFLPVAMGLVHLLRVPLGTFFTAVLKWTPYSAADWMFPTILKVVPASDRAVLGAPGMRTMMIDDLYHGSRERFRAQIADVSAFGRDWGFSARDIRVPIRIYHGSQDGLVPMHQAEHLAGLIPDSELVVYEGEGHFAGYARAPQVLDWLAEHVRTG